MIDYRRAKLKANVHDLAAGRVPLQRDADLQRRDVRE
jgi:hypothetical protein